MTAVMLCVSSYLFPFVPTEEAEDEEEALKSFLPEKVFLLLLLRGVASLASGAELTSAAAAEEEGEESGRGRQRGRERKEERRGPLFCSFRGASSLLS